MVRSPWWVTVMLLSATPASAQSVDWRQAGGDLFGRPPAAEVTGAAGVFEGVPVLPALSQPFMEAIAAAAERHGLDPKLLHALVIVESGYRSDAVSSAGAGGLTQLMPGTAADLAVRNRFDPVENLNGGADYLARQLLRFGDVRLAFAAYNAGPDRVARLGRIPDIAETQAYVTAVVDCYLALTAGQGPRSSRQCRPAGAVL